MVAADLMPEAASFMSSAMTSRGQRRSPVHSEWMVRYAEPAEFDDVAALLLRANAQYRDAMPPGIFRAYCDNLQALALDPAMHDAGEILVIAGAGRRAGLLGTVTIFPDAAVEGLGWPRGWAGLRALAVDPAARGYGFGRRLSEAAIGRARAIGAPILALHNAAFQAAARRLYLDLGFVRCPQYDFDAGDTPAFKTPGERMAVEAFALRLA